MRKKITTEFWLSLMTLTISSALGCALFSKAQDENLYKIHIGQSREEVIDAVGEPVERILDGPSERWHYDIASRDQRRSYPYTAVFQDNKLNAWYFDTARVGAKHDGESPPPRAKP